MSELIIRERERESSYILFGKEALHWHSYPERGYEALGGNPNG